MEKSAAPKLSDVARLAGVSTATVSRCFNAPDMVVEATREKVMRIVDELGYTPHFGGRALASNRSNTMGAIIPTMENAIFARGIQAFQETLADLGITLLFASSGYDPEIEYRQIRTLMAQGADGLLLIGGARPEKTYDFLARRNVPFVISWNYNPDWTCYQVGFDNRQASRVLAEKVIQFGHRDIAMISGSTHFNDRAADRISGVRDAMDGAGLSGQALGIVEASYTLRDGRKALGKLLRDHPEITAVICGNDVLAVGALSKARDLGLRVPEDLSITGFDDIDLSEVTTPQITTLHVPHRRMGKAAARLLVDIRDGKPGCRSIELETRIAMRGSLGPAPDRG